MAEDDEWEYEYDLTSSEVSFEDESCFAIEWLTETDISH